MSGSSLRNEARFSPPKRGSGLRPGDCDPNFGCFLGSNRGDNFINTVIDGDATADLLSAGAAAAPFTGSWFASINSPEWASPAPEDPMEQYAGAGTRSDWQLLVTDYEPFDSGRLNSSSLIVTPMTYECCRSPASGRRPNDNVPQCLPPAGDRVRVSM